MTAILKRLMWPRKGEQITLYQNGRMVVEGIVIQSTDITVSVLDKEGYVTELDANELKRGIEDRSIVVKKVKQSQVS
jgi:hypothetical protein